ncbi:MAG: hypothetical protein GY796_30525 [Chloroflexi bacterium]|nr:hypothetical protein [Chloroflexota bacterium]
MNRKILAIAGIIVLVMVLAAGAYTAVNLTAAQDEPEDDLPAGSMVFEDVMDDGTGNPVTVKTVILPAEALPKRPSEAGGVLVRQVDNSYFVGTGSISVNVSTVNGETSTAVDHSGPEIEAVTNHDTLFYRDVTDFSLTAAESKEQTFRQEIILVDQPEKMPDGATIQVWGNKSGDRIIADIIVYSEPK